MQLAGRAFSSRYTRTSRGDGQRRHVRFCLSRCPLMGLTLRALRRLRLQWKAQHLEIHDEMRKWTEEEANLFFMSGGRERPKAQQRKKKLKGQGKRGPAAALRSGGSCSDDLERGTRSVGTRHDSGSKYARASAVGSDDEDEDDEDEDAAQSEQAAAGLATRPWMPSLCVRRALFGITAGLLVAVLASELWRGIHGSGGPDGGAQGVSFFGAMFHLGPSPSPPPSRPPTPPPQPPPSPHHPPQG